MEVDTWTDSEQQNPMVTYKPKKKTPKKPRKRQQYQQVATIKLKQPQKKRSKVDKPTSKKQQISRQSSGFPSFTTPQFGPRVVEQPAQLRWKYQKPTAPSKKTPFSTKGKQQRQQKGKQQRQQQPQREQRKRKFGGLNMNDWVFFINDERVSDDVRDQRFPMNLNTLSEVLSNYLDLTDCFWRQDINIPKRIDVSKVEKNLLQFSDKDDFQFCNDAKFREELDSFKYLTEEDEDKFRSELRKRTPPTKSSLPRTSEIGKYPTKQWTLVTDNPHQKIFASKMGYSKFK